MAEFITADSEHWYPSPKKPDVWYPSVTTILSVFPKGVGFNKYLTQQSSWESAEENLKEAGKRGTNVHKGSEMLELGETLQRGIYTVQEWQMLMGFVAWHDLYKPELHKMEYGLVSDKHKTGGTIDRVYTINGFKTVFDLKTSGSIHDNYWCQVAMYAQMYEEKHKGEIIDQTAILRVTDRKKSLFEFQTKTRDEWKEDLKIFKAVQEVWTYLNPNAQPKILELPEVLKLDDKINEDH